MYIFINIDIIAYTSRCEPVETIKNILKLPDTSMVPDLQQLVYASVQCEFNTAEVAYIHCKYQYVQRGFQKFKC